jgi:fatty acid-binding protein DegV
LKAQLMNKSLRSLIKALETTAFSDRNKTYSAISFDHKTKANLATFAKVARHGRVMSLRICRRDNTQAAQIGIGNIGLRRIALIAGYATHPLL